MAKKNFVWNEPHREITKKRARRTLKNTKISTGSVEDLLEEDGFEDLPDREASKLRNRWKSGRSNINNSGKRWLKSQKGKPWNDVRAEFMEKIGNDKEILKYAITEKTTRDDEGNIILHPKEGAPYVLGYYGPEIYVDPEGIVQYTKEEKLPKWEQKNYIHIEGGTLWYKTENGSVFHVPLSEAEEPDLYQNTSYTPNIHHNYVHIGAYLGYGEIRGKRFSTSKVKQASAKKVPEAVKELVPLGPPSKKKMVLGYIA